MHARERFYNFLSLLNEPAQFSRKRGISANSPEAWAVHGLSAIYRETLRMRPVLQDKARALAISQDDADEAVEEVYGLALVGQASNKLRDQYHGKVGEELDMRGTAKVTVAWQCWFNQNPFRMTPSEATQLLRDTEKRLAGFIPSGAEIKVAPPEFCAVPNCMRVFRRAPSKRAQIDCPACRRRFTPKQTSSMRARAIG